MSQLILIRHGQSTWNLENKFTGWEDVDLTAKGIDEAKAAGLKLRSEGYDFQAVFTSTLCRAIRSTWVILHATKRMWLPVEKCWQLNERHYGALQGLNKDETRSKYGDEQVKTWRRSFDTPPPPSENTDFYSNHPLYKQIDPSHWPQGESLKMTQERVMPLWTSNIEPLLKQDKSVLVVAHGNSLRALIKHLEQLSAEDIVQIELPTGKPLIYNLDKDLTVLSKKSL